MSRGKQLKTKMKEAVQEASIVAEAIKLAELKLERKDHEKKSLLDSARQHIGKIIDRVDPLETAAVIGTTVLIHGFILSIEGFAGELTATLANKVSDIGISGITQLATNLGFKLDLPTAPQAQAKPPQDNITLWLLSFVVAFILVRYGAQILSSFGGLKGLIGGMAGLPNTQ